MEEGKLLLWLPCQDPFLVTITAPHPTLGHKRPKQMPFVDAIPGILVQWDNNPLSTQLSCGRCPTQAFLWQLEVVPNEWWNSSLSYCRHQN